MTQQKKGFTLIELMVVMAIIAVLAVLMIGAIQLARSTATETIHRSNGKTIQTAMEGYYAKNKQYPVYGTAGSPVSFKTAADDTHLKVAITTSCTATGKEDGGTVWSTATTYAIQPYDSACAAVLTKDLLEVK